MLVHPPPAPPTHLVAVQTRPYLSIRTTPEGGNPIVIAQCRSRNRQTTKAGKGRHKPLDDYGEETLFDERTEDTNV
jgi:hypothetical protein